MKEESDSSLDKPRYSEASNKVLDELWKCRESREKSNNRHRFSAREDILQRIWSKIVIESLDRQKKTKKYPDKFPDDYAILDETYVDGTIFMICEDYKKELETIENLQWILKPISFEIISKDIDDFKKEIDYCKYNLISLHGRRRLNLMRIGEDLFHE